MSKDEGMTKPEYIVPVARQRDSVLESGSPLPLLLLRAGSKSARGLVQSKTWRQANRSVESLHSIFRSHWSQKPTPNPSREGNWNDADECLLPSWEGSGVGRFMECPLSVFRHSDFFRHSSFDIRHCEFVIRSPARRGSS